MKELNFERENVNITHEKILKRGRISRAERRKQMQEEDYLKRTRHNHVN